MCYRATIWNMQPDQTRDEVNQKAPSHWLSLSISGGIILAFFAFQLAPPDAIYGWTRLIKVAVGILSPFAFIYLVAVLFRKS